VRLVEGPLEHEGCIEVLYNNEWGKVCDTSLGRNDGNVVCRQLGYNESVLVFGWYGGGSSRGWINSLSCTGSETSIDQCPHSTIEPFNCRCAGVLCAIRQLGECLVSGHIKC